MSETIEKLLQKGSEFHQLGQAKFASQIYKVILLAEPNHPEASYNMGLLAVSAGQIEAGLTFLETALDANADNAMYWVTYIDVLLEIGRIEDAQAVFDQAKFNGAKGEGFDKLEQRLTDGRKEPLTANSTGLEEKHPKQPNILDSLKLDQALSLARKKARGGDTGEAKRIYQDILAKFPKNKRARDGLKGLSSGPVGKESKVQDPPHEQLQALINLYSQGQLQQALHEAETLVQKFPQSAILFNVQGAVFKDLGQLDQSIEAYNKALATKPDYAEAYNNMGNALEAQGKLEEAIEAYNKALTIKPDYAEAYNNMGNVLKEQGKLEEAIEAYSTALTIKPDYANAIENSLSLAVQLLPIIANYEYDFNNSETHVNSEIVPRPVHQILNAIKAYLEGDFSLANSHKDNFEACDQNLLGRLKPKDKVFCNAYSNFIGKLLDANWDEEPATENKVYHLGESHCLSYAHRNITMGSSNFRITPRITFGAKAFHFSRAKHEKFKAITKAHFVSLPKNSKVFLSYGEIDCRPNEGFISAARKRDKPLEELIDQTTEGYVQWFLEQNAGQRHHLYFINVPAPVYDEKLTTDLNSEVASTVALFNAALKKYSLQHGFDTVDVFKFTAGKEGFSNGLFHIDNHHLGAKALVEVNRQLS